MLCEKCGYVVTPLGNIDVWYCDRCGWNRDATIPELRDYDRQRSMQEDVMQQEQCDAAETYKPRTQLDEDDA